MFLVVSRRDCPRPAKPETRGNKRTHDVREYVVGGGALGGTRPPNLLIRSQSSQVSVYIDSILVRRYDIFFQYQCFRERLGAKFSPIE